MQGLRCQDRYILPLAQDPKEEIFQGWGQGGVNKVP